MMCEFDYQGMPCETFPGLDQRKESRLMWFVKTVVRSSTTFHSESLHQFRNYSPPIVPFTSLVRSTLQIDARLTHAILHAGASLLILEHFSQGMGSLATNSTADFSNWQADTTIAYFVKYWIASGPEAMGNIWIPSNLTIVATSETSTSGAGCLFFCGLQRATVMTGPTWLPNQGHGRRAKPTTLLSPEHPCKKGVMLLTCDHTTYAPGLASHVSHLP